MSDRSPDTQDTPLETTPNGEINTSRRKLAGAALGVSAVFTLASRPVWANQCTISGMASGNLSAPKGPACAGCSHGYWKNHTDSWSGYKTTDKFNAVFNVASYVKNGAPYTLLEVLNLQGNDDPLFPMLGAQAVGALLNAAHSSVNYGYTSGEIIALFKNTPTAKAQALMESLDMLNNRGCPLN